MKYIEVTFQLGSNAAFRDMLIDSLGNEGPFDSFVETTDGLKAYVTADQFSETFVAETVAAIKQLSPSMAAVDCRYSISEVPDKNWNEEWERNHTAVMVEEPSRIYVRAPFHQPRPDVDYEIVIEPKMSFGTAHHQTTRMMLSFVAAEPLAGRRLLDMGTGTGVLAILAKMRGASYVEAIDVDEWAYRNAIENAERNDVDINIHLGDATSLAGQFDVVLANINKNILLRDMAAYTAVLNHSGTLIISGFYNHDEPALVSHAASLGLEPASRREADSWASLRFVKQ